MSRLRASTNMYTSLRRSAQQIPESVLSGNFRADSGTRINKSLPSGVMALLITQPWVSNLQKHTGAPEREAGGGYKEREWKLGAETPRVQAASIMISYL